MGTTRYYDEDGDEICKVHSTEEKLMDYIEKESRNIGRAS